MARHKNTDWNLPTSCQNWTQVAVIILMDIRDELQSLNRKANCHRIPRALDGMYELGVEARRRKRLAAKKRKAARS